MTLLVIDLTITLDSALSIGAGGSAGTIADKSIVRDGWGRPTIPGSQVKGKLRWAIEQLLRGLGHDIPPPF
jgi:CRISPR/Cas system CSM-associated protein Csm3 (group 7 of RAMP superfamily)